MILSCWGALWWQYEEMSPQNYKLHSFIIAHFPWLPTSFSLWNLFLHNCSEFLWDLVLSKYGKCLLLIIFYNLLIFLIAHFPGFISISFDCSSLLYFQRFVVKPFYLKREKQKASENMEKTLGQVIINSLGNWHCCCVNSMNSSLVLGS